MALRFPLLLALQLLLSLLIPCIFAGKLVELPPPGKRSTLFRRDDYGGLNLQDEEVFLWGGSSTSAAAANFTVSMPADHENILSMERFASLLSSVSCTNGSVSLQFKSSDAFAYAQKEWSWVNGGNRTFVLVAGAYQCSSNPHRIPLVVSRASFDNTTKMVNLGAVYSEWSKVAHTSELWVGSVAPPPSSRLRPRDFAQTLTLDFEHTLPKNWSSWEIPIHVDNVTLSVECEDCGTHGEFDWTFHFQTTLFIPTGVSLTLQPKGVSVSVTPALHVEADLLTQIQAPLERLGTIPIDGITIPGGILDLGPEIVVNTGGSIGPVSADATISGGVEVVLDDTAVMDIGFTTPSFHASGWLPHFQAIPLTISAEVKGQVEIFLQFSAQFSLEALGRPSHSTFVFDITYDDTDHGFEIGLVLQPFVQAEYTYKESSAGACADDKEERPFGIEIDPTLGIILSGDAEEDDDPQNPIFSDQIASATLALPTACFAFGPAKTTAV